MLERSWVVKTRYFWRLHLEEVREGPGAGRLLAYVVHDQDVAADIAADARRAVVVVAALDLLEH